MRIKHQLTNEYLRGLLRTCERDKGPPWGHCLVARLVREILRLRKESKANDRK